MMNTLLLSARWLRLAALGSTLALGQVHAAEPPTAPVLRIEAGMHTAAINRISADAAGRLVLAVSNDKTARLWELPSGRLLRVLRPPIDADHEGKLYAGALSPDGSLAAVGGFTGKERHRDFSVFLFETSTGRLVRRLTGLPNVVTDLAFSKKGRFLAAVLFEGMGLRVWDTNTGQELGRDTDYSDRDSYGVDWHGEERLVTTSRDGNLRLYHLGAASGGLELQRLAKAAARGGQEPFTARFSPDGRRIAVGFADSIKIAVVDGNDLSFLDTPDIAGDENESLAHVTWTDNGVVAGGRWRDGGADENCIFYWWPELGAVAGLGAAKNSISGLRTPPGRSILFAAFDPIWGVFSADGKRSIVGATPLADYRGNSKGFRLSGDGMEVTFGFSLLGKSPARFSISDRKLSLLKEGAALPAFLSGPRLDGLYVTDWENSSVPKLAGKALNTARDETSRVVAIARDASSFLLGTDWFLRSFSAKGTKRWEIPAPDPVAAVNLTADDQLGVAAYGDGTIRWHRADTGQELLAFFPHADRQRWVLWTPESYYDCSPGAESLIGWHVNRGKDQAADFFPAAKFRVQFYRPDVIQEVLAKGDVTAALKAANEAGGRRSATPVAAAEAVVAKMAPPVVELAMGGARGEATVPADAASFTVRYRVRRGGAEPVSRVFFKVDGRPVSVDAPLPASETAETEARLPLPAGNCLLSVLAENNSGIASEPATLRIVRAAAPAGPRPAAEPAALKPNLYLVAVGVADLKMNDAFDLDRDGRTTEAELEKGDPQGTVPFSDLHYADADARDIAASFKTQQGLLYAKVETRVLVNKDATATAIRDGLEWLRQETTTRDVAVIFFSGHGENDNVGGFYFLGHEYEQKRRMSTGVSFEEIKRTVKDPAGKLILMIDSCHAGNALGKLFTGKGGVDINRVVNELAAAENGAIVFASSTGRQKSLESPALKHGVFAQAIIDGLGGKADVLNEGLINVSGLEAYVASWVKKFTDGAQTPTVAKPQTVPDFPIAVKR